MRTTIDLPTDLHHAVNSIAAHTRKSMNQTVAELIRRGLAQPPQGTGDVSTSAVRSTRESTGGMGGQAGSKAAKLPFLAPIYNG